MARSQHLLHLLATSLQPAPPRTALQGWNPLAALAIPAGGAAELALYGPVLQAWAGPGRAYHDLLHLQEMLGHCAAADQAVGFQQPAEVFLATLFHDAVYDTRRSDNEAASAELARTAIADEPALAGVDVARVVALIDATARHGKHAPSEVDGDEVLFLDADTAILGADVDRYRDYVVAVRDEYRWVEEAAFVAGRTRFVSAIAAAPSVFLSPFFRARLEARARANLARELGWLTGSDAPPWALASGTTPR